MQPPSRDLTYLRDVHLVSLVHALVAVVLASRCLQAQTLNDDTIFGTYPDASFLLAIAVG